ncbi:unnamed protein product [Orchesella dallaii]|uniref:Gustatory receptor n=1 Tax=Orchesella dallaii TaxID=48710 RepID=A0ABP1R2A8_9HEXA
MDTYASPESTSNHENYEKLIRSSLLKLLSLPVKISQAIGAFIFSLEPNAELTFSWYSWPMTFFALKLAYGLYATMLFIHHESYYIAIFGGWGWGDVDRKTNFLALKISEFSSIFNVIMTIKERHRIQAFHRSIVQFIVDVLIEHEHENVIKEHLRMFAKTRKQIATTVSIIIALSCVTYLIFLSSFLFSVIKVLNADIYIVAALPVILFYVGFLSSIRFIHILILDATISFIWFGLRAWRSQCENVMKDLKLGHHETKEKMSKILCNYNRIVELIKEFNSGYQWWLLSGMLTMLAYVLCYLFQFGSWFGIAGIVVFVVLIPGFLACGLSLYYFCLAASNVNEEGKLCALMLRNIGSCTNYDNDLKEKVTSEYKL